MKKELISIFSTIAALVSIAVPTSTALAQTELNIGDYVKIGSYKDQPILWRYVGDDENGKLMVSKDIICYKSYDAAGKQSDIEDRVTFGSNIWSESAIRSWLNSDQAVVNYEHGSAPTKENVWMSYNPYDTEAGFLANFNNDEKNSVKEVTIKTTLNDADAGLADGEYKTVTYDYDFNESIETKKYQNSVDKVFLLDENQLKMIISNFADGFYMSEDSVIDSGAYKGLDTSMKSGYLLRSPNTYEKAADKVYIVLGADGKAYCDSSMEAYMSSGIRPALYLNDNVEFPEGNGTKSNPYVISNAPVEATPGNSETSEKILAIANDNYGIRLFLNDEEVNFPDAKPFIDNNSRTQIPLRAVAEELKYNVAFDAATKEVTVDGNGKRISLVIGSNILKCNDDIIEMDTEAQIYNERTYIPVRFVGEALGYKVEYAKILTGWAIDENGKVTPLFK